MPKIKVLYDDGEKQEIREEDVPDSYLPSPSPVVEDPAARRRRLVEAARSSRSLDDLRAVVLEILGD